MAFVAVAQRGDRVDRGHSSGFVQRVRREQGEAEPARAGPVAGGQRAVGEP